MLLAKLRSGAAGVTARMALEMATGRGRMPGASRRDRRLSPGAAGDMAVWPLAGPAFAGAIADAVEAWLRCGPVSADTPSSPDRRWSPTARSCTRGSTSDSPPTAR